MATMRDVAALANVSAKTVSRVFNNDPHVTPETKQRVEAALRELNYVPNTLATTFRAGRAPVIGVAVPDIVDPFFGAIAKAAETLAAKHDMSVVITSLGDNPTREPDVVRSLLRQALSGLIIAPVSHEQSYLKAWSTRTPLVFVDRTPAGVSADSFTEDDYTGAYEATEHLIQHGHTRIGFIGDDTSVPTSSNRLDGYRAALHDHGIDNDDRLVGLGAFDRVTAADAFAALEHATHRPTALFSSNARVTMNLVPVLQGSGLAVTAFGDFPMADMLSPALSVIDQDPFALGALAAQRILDRLANPDRRFRRRTVLPVRLIERESCLITDRLDGKRRRPAGIVRRTT
jgi:LacI family transcriptional regulator